jgi:SAM-dependent methyltransferase
VLDLGCGSGRSALPLAARGYTVVGIDLSQAMLGVMGRKPVRGEGRVMPLRANLVQLECLAERSADHAICLFSTLGMIQGRDNRLRMLRHVHRIVRPGGRLLIHVHHRWAAIREYQGIRSLVRSRVQSIFRTGYEFGDTVYAYRGLDRMFMHRFSKSELRADIMKSGWQIASLWPVAIDGSSISSRFAIAGGFLVLATA